MFEPTVDGITSKINMTIPPKGTISSNNHHPERFVSCNRLTDNARNGAIIAIPYANINTIPRISTNIIAIIDTIITPI